MMSWRVISNPEDDITAGYRFSHKEEAEDFFQVLKIDMNYFKSIWGLMLGI